MSLLVGCPKAPGPEGPSGPDGQPTSTAAPTAEVAAPSASANAEPVDPGDMSEAQRNALNTLRAAKGQDPRKFDDATKQVLRQISAKELNFVGMTQGQLVRALGQPNQPPEGQASKDRAAWTIGKLPSPMPMHPPVLEVIFDDKGVVKTAGVRRSM